MCKRFFIVAGLLGCLPALAQATDLTTLLNPGYFKLEADMDYHVLKIFGYSGENKYSFQESQAVYPLRMHYGLARGAELAFTLPLTSRILAGSSEQNLNNRDWSGFGDLEGGMKFHFLTDTVYTPAIFVEALMKIPTGRSRFRDYVRTLDDPGAPLSGTDQGTYDLILKGIMSMFLDPLELFLQLQIDVPGGDDFTTGGIHNHIDYGDRGSLSGGLEMDLLDNLTLAAEAVEISTAASAWTQDGENALAQAGTHSSALMAQTRTRAGVALGNITELYAGPTLTWNVLPSTQLKLALLFGLTPDSEKFRSTAGLSTAFSVARLLDFKRGDASPKPGPLVAETPPNSIFLQPEDASETGNRQRFIARLTEKAQANRKTGHLGAALRDWNLILAQFPEEQAAQTAAAQTKEELAIAVQTALGKAALALSSDNLLAAVRAWREVLYLDPRQEAALTMLRNYEYQIREHARQGYLQGMEFYARGDYQDALARWEDARILTPGDNKISDSIGQTRKKIEALRMIGNQK
jgi:tetratricopeptide (TPR) repeat protein